MDICVFCEEQVQNTMEKRSGTQEQVSALDTAMILFYNYTTNNYVRTYSFLIGPVQNRVKDGRKTRTYGSHLPSRACGTEYTTQQAPNLNTGSVYYGLSACF